MTARSSGQGRERVPPDIGSNAPVVIRMVIPTTRLLPSGSDRIEGVPILTSGNPSASVVSDCKIPPRNRKVEGFESLFRRHRRGSKHLLG
jgi:hypothetical protein